MKETAIEIASCGREREREGDGQTNVHVDECKFIKRPLSDKWTTGHQTGRLASHVALPLSLSPSICRSLFNLSGLLHVDSSRHSTILTH